MKCGVCHATLLDEAEKPSDGNADFWICKKCYLVRELEPYDKPETALSKSSLAACLAINYIFSLHAMALNHSLLTSELDWKR